MMGTTGNQTVKFAQWETAHDDILEEDLNKFVDTYWQVSNDNEDEDMDF